MEEKSCLRCGAALERVKERFELGGDGWSVLSAMLSKALEVDVYACPQCGRMEFFLVREEAREPEELVTCPECGARHSRHINCPDCLATKGPGFFRSGRGRQEEPDKARDPWKRK